MRVMPGRLTMITMKPSPIMTGKPTAKIFSCGAARLITPNARLTTTSGNRRQRHQHGAGEHCARPSSPVPTSRWRTIRSCRPAGSGSCRASMLQQQQVTVQREENQRRQHQEILAHHRHLHAALRIQATQSRGPCSWRWSGRRSIAAKTICSVKPMASPTSTWPTITRPWRERMMAVGIAATPSARSRRQGQRQRQSNALRHQCAIEHRRCHQHGADAHERPQEGAHAGVQLQAADGKHAAPPFSRSAPGCSGTGGA